MKKIALFMVAVMYLSSSTLNADVWNTSKNYASKAMFWKSGQLKDIDFEHVYPKAFYKKSYFGYAVTSAAVLAAGAATFYTAGGGTSAAVVGVSTVASAFTSGSSANIAGLASIGNFFGGNANLGAAILGGISSGVMGGGVASLATMPIVEKVGAMAFVTASGLDGVLIFTNPDTKEIEYRIKLMIPKELGEKSTRKIVEKIYDAEDELNDARKEKNNAKQKTLQAVIDSYEIQAVSLLETILGKKESTQDDIIVLSTIASNRGNFELFKKAIDKFDMKNIDNKGFLFYLFALKNLYSGNLKEAYLDLDKSISDNDYAIEAILLYINLLGNENFTQNESKILDLMQIAENKFNGNKYTTRYDLTSLYYRIGTLYFLNEKYGQAEYFYKKSYDEIGLLQKKFLGEQLGRMIELGIANSIYKQGKIDESKKIYEKIMLDAESTSEMEQLKSQYIGND